MKIFLGSDHGGFKIKEIIKSHLLERGYDIEDVGTHSTDSCDYPIYGQIAGINAFALGSSNFFVSSIASYIDTL